MIRLPEIKSAELSTYGNFAKCHQALFRVPREGLGTRLVVADSIDQAWSSRDMCINWNELQYAVFMNLATWRR